MIYARREETAHHAPAKRLLHELSRGAEPWALPWPCCYEFVRVVTHPKVFSPPSPLEVVVADLESLLSCPSLVLLGEGGRHPLFQREALLRGRATGNLAHDAHIAALLLEHGVTLFYTTDRDFRRFPGVRMQNPFDSM